MTHHINTLPNGLRVVTAPMPDAQSLTIQLIVGVGSRYETASQNGVSHFLEHLLFKGTKKRPSTKIISEQIDAVGGWSNAYTANDVTAFYVKVPHPHGRLGIDILSDMMRHSLFEPVEIDRERAVILEEMNVYRDDPASFVQRLVPKLLWPNHPLSFDVIGTEDVIKNISRDQILSHHQSFYAPNNIVVCCAGKVDHQEFVGQVKALMGDMPSKLVEPAKTVAQKISADKVSSIAKDTAQTHLMIGGKAYHYLDPKYPAARVMSAILGRGLSSRLFLNVREQKGLAYTINTNLESFVDTGHFDVYAGVNNTKIDEAIAAILEELKIMANQKVGEAELSKAKNQLIGGIQMAMESNLNVADRLSSHLILIGEIISIEETISKIKAVTSEQVTAVAAEILNPSKLRMGIITPEPSQPTKAFERLTS